MYANAAPHIGFALELIQADVLARYNRIKLGDKYVRFVTGTDEHGTTVARAAQKIGIEPQALVNEVSQKVQSLATALNISNDDFIRTSDRARHWPAAEKIWRTLAEKGALYKKSYEGLYCVGHEAFIKKSELIDGLCPLHKTKPEELQEENWFFKLTDYKATVKEKIESGELAIVPETRKQEILNLIDDAEDVSFSRPSKDLTWGIPVPGDPSQTMYVWADALTNYLSALGYGTDEALMQFWPADIHLIGKDILRFHAMIWPAMLLAAGIPLPRAIYVHGFITVDGQKMSKTIGNIVDPFALLEQYPAEVIRYFLMREIPSGDDGDFSGTNLDGRYNSDLANGLGNFSARVLKLASLETFDGTESPAPSILAAINSARLQVDQNIGEFKFHEALSSLWELIARGDSYINETQAWKREDRTVTFGLVLMLEAIAEMLRPFIPETSSKILSSITREGSVVRAMPSAQLFPRRS